MTDISMKKDSLRREVLAQAAALDGQYKREADLDICRQVGASWAFREAKTVFCYVGHGDEINTRPILEQALAKGKRLCVPLCEKKGIMTARQIFHLSELSPGMYQIPEPGGDAPLVLPQDIDLAIIPCVTCNEAGDRLGYGGGYYDRYLRLTFCRKMILCRKKLMQPHIPTEAHDLPIEQVVYEQTDSK